MEIGRYNLSRFAELVVTAPTTAVAVATGARRVATVRFWESSSNCGSGSTATGRESIYVVGVDGHPCWVMISDSESLAMASGEDELREVAMDLATCPDCARGTHRRRLPVTIYPGREERRADFEARVRAIVEGSRTTTAARGGGEETP